MAKPTYVCSICGGTFEIGWSDEEARAEYERRFGIPFDPADATLVCDGCDKRVMRWLKRKLKGAS